VQSSRHIVDVVIHPLDTPRVRRLCAGCGASSMFRSSGRFRVNANGRHLDVWLIYKCVLCETTWNLTVHERVPVRRLDPALLYAYTTDCPEAARRTAFDAALLARAGAAVEGDVPVSCDVTLPGGFECADAVEVRLLCSHPATVRLDRLLCRLLTVSRTELARLVEAGQVSPVDGGRRELRRAVRSGQKIRVERTAWNRVATILPQRV